MSIYGPYRDHRDDGCHIRVLQGALVVIALLAMIRAVAIPTAP